MRPRLTIALAIALAIPLVAAAPRPASATENWNQWDDPAVSGVGHGATKLAIGIDWGHVPGSHTLRLGGDFEHLLRDRWGLVGRVALPFDGEWVAPILLGVRLHALPLTPFDPFVGLAGGVAWLRVDGRDARVDPMASGEAGFAFHYFGLFFFEASARFDLVRYAASDGAIDRSGLVIDGRTGVYF